MSDKKDDLFIMLLGGRYQASVMLALELRPRAVVCVASEDSVKAGEDVNRLLRHLLPEAERAAIVPTQPYDTRAALLAVEQARAVFPNLRPCISVTSAPVPMAVAGYELARRWGCPAWYVNTRDGQVIDLTEPENTRPLQVRLSVREYLRLYNVQEAPADRPAETTANWGDLAHQLGRSGEPAAELLAWLRRDNLQTTVCRKAWPAHFGNFHRQLINLLAGQRLLSELRFSSTGQSVVYRVADEQAAAFLRGGWLEQYVWETAERLRAAREVFDACERGLRVRLSEAEREIDLIAAGRGLALVASCKAVNKPWDKKYLDEIAAVANLLGGNYCARLFITDQPVPVSEPGVPDRFQQFAEQARRQRVVLVTAHKLARLAEVFRKEMSSSPTYARV